MKHKRISRLLSVVLAAAVTASLWGGVNAEPVKAAELSDAGIAQQQPIGEPFTDVTEEAVAAFERSLEKELRADRSDTAEKKETLAELAQKKAKVLCNMYDVTSVQYAIMQKGELVLSDAYGTDDAKKKTKVNTDSVYGIASISKMFTTTAVLQLAEAGKLSLDTPVVDYVPEFQMKDARYKDITVRMLLNHSSGIMGGGLNSALLFDDTDTQYHDNLLQKLAGEELKADPGAYSVYCNDGFVLAEIVVEHVSGETFSDYLKKHIYEPLGLTHVYTPLQLTDEAALAGTYLTDSKDRLPAECFNAIGTGGLYANAEDLCTFGMTYTENYGKLLSDASVDATYVEEGRKGQWCEEYSGSVNFGLGWDSVSEYPFADLGIRAADKGGDSLFYHGSLMVLPDQDLTVCVLSVGGASIYDNIFAQLLTTTYLTEQGTVTEEALSAVPKKYELKSKKTAVPKSMSDYNGYYVSTAGTYKVKMAKNGLKLVSLSSPDTTMNFYYRKDGYFVFSGGAQALKFVTQNGRKYLMVGSYSKLTGIATGFNFTYCGEKAATKKLAKSVQKAWDARSGKRYFMVNEKYSSAYYPLGAAVVDVDGTVSPSGYFYYNKITGADTAVQFTDIPMTGSRDAGDYVFTTDADGNEWMSYAGQRLIEESGLKALSAKKSFKVKISQTTGDAKWYRITKKTAGKKMTVTLSEDQHAMAAVYDKDGTFVYSTLVSGKKTVKLPKNGYVVFAGDAGVSISVKLK